MTIAAQRTVREAVRFTGVGLHCGLPCTATILPATAGSGVIFVSPRGEVRAHVRNVVGTRLTTSLRGAGASGLTVHTVEHLLAALAAHRVDNARVRLQQDRARREVSVPILDGSALPYSEALRNNVVELPGTRRTHIRVRRTVEVIARGKGNEKWIKFRPPAAATAAQALDLAVTVDFGDRIRVGKGGQQHIQFRLDNGSSESFRRDIAGARTFCFENDLQGLRNEGLVKGGRFENALVFGVQNGDCLTPGGLRFDDEACRHKLLDCIGDLSLAGAPLVGQIEAFRPGHELNWLAVMTLLSNPANYHVVE